MTINELQLGWARSVDSERSNSGQTWYVETCIFKTGDMIYLQNDGDGEFSLCFVDKANSPFQIRTGFKSADEAKIWLEKNDAENLLALIPAITEHLK